MSPNLTEGEFLPIKSVVFHIHPSDHFFFLISGERCFYLPSQEQHSCLKNHVQKLSTVAHDMTLYRASTGPDFLFAYSMPVLHLTYKMLNVSSTRTFLLIKRHCKAIKVYNLLLFCWAKLECLLFWYKRTFWVIWVGFF